MSKQPKSDWAEQPYEAWQSKKERRPAPQKDNRKQCEACGQRHMRKAEMLHAQGTRHGTSEGPRYTVNHHSQTDLAARYAPPPLDLRAHNRWFAILCACVLTVYMIPLQYFMNTADMDFIDRFGAKAGLMVAAGIGGYLFVRFCLPGVYRRLRDMEDEASAHHSQATQDYFKTWVCMDCGHEQVED